jgi:hypothetical protein
MMNYDEMTDVEKLGEKHREGRVFVHSSYGLGIGCLWRCTARLVRPAPFHATCPKLVSARQSSHSQVSAGHGFWASNRMRPMRRPEWIESEFRTDLVGS